MGETWSFVAVLVLVVSALAVLTSGRSQAARERARLAARIASLERTVEATAAHLGVVVPDPQHPEVVQFLQAGRKIPAIKRYREDTGADVVTAKHAVDDIARRRGL